MRGNMLQKNTFIYFLKELLRIFLSGIVRVQPTWEMYFWLINGEFNRTGD